MIVEPYDSGPLSIDCLETGAIRESNCVPNAELARENRQSALFFNKKETVDSE